MPAQPAVAPRTSPACQAESAAVCQQGPTRRAAELHYKIAMAQQYMEQPEAALSSVKAAIAILEKVVAQLRPPPQQPASFSFGVPDAADVEPSTEAAPAEDPQVWHT